MEIVAEHGVQKLTRRLLMLQVVSQSRIDPFRDPFGAGLGKLRGDVLQSHSEILSTL
jgi:hypothetical protein